MTVANAFADSDQKRRTQQRAQTLWFVGLILAAVMLGGCMKPALKAQAPTIQQSTEMSHDETAIEVEQADCEFAEITPPEPPPPPAQIWQRLRSGFQLSAISHPRIEREIRRLERSPDAFHAMMAKAEPYLHHIVDAIESGGLPMEIALLPAVESGFRAYAYSPDGAAGLWQFMPATGRMFGLHQDWWFDRRRSLEASTEAAIAYLSKLNQRFEGDWLHTLAAYNAGAGKVGKAIRRARKRGEDIAFWSLDLPGETDRYVPRLLALAIVVNDPERHGLSLPAIIDRPYYQRVATDGQIDLTIAAGLAGMEVDEVLKLNPGHKRWASRPDGPHELLLPLDKVNTFRTNLATLPKDQRLRWQRHRIRPGDSLNRIARQYGVSAKAIRQSNGLRDARIRAGKDLLIPLSDAARESSRGANRLARHEVRYRVRKGDSLYTIARRFQVSIADLRRWNEVGRYIRPGERLTVFVDPDA